MITINDYRNYWKHAVFEIADLKSYHLVATEEGLGKKIKDLKASDFPAVIAVIPSANPDSRDVDNVKEINQALIFVLIRRGAADRSDEVYVTDMDLTQAVMKDIKQLMTDDKSNCDSEYHEHMKRLQVGSFHQDPEYNYVGCDGWSLSFEFETEGF